MQGSKQDKLISAGAADRLIAAHDGDLALLYLYRQRTGRDDTESAARDLCRTLAEMDAAHEKLGRLGLLDGDTPAPAAPRTEPRLPPAEELPEYRAEDLTRRCRDDSAFSALVGEAQKVLGHTLSTQDLKKLFGIYDYLALPAEVIMTLLNYCVSASPGRRPTMRYIEKEAYAWSNREILTLEQAEDYIGERRRRREQSSLVAEALGIRGRALTATEGNYIAAWLDMGFALEPIALAYDRTVTNTGSLKWSYMNRILQSWKEKGLYTVAEIEAGDARRPARAGGGGAVDLSDLRSMLKTK